ncbi:MAG: M48 family metallopeptidase [Candidatus Marinimicrobia bacterium]|nr:M48 family metallopeptidase [Candidatus Neomarinimicrobiota bacterium]MBT3936605.1 M48 family metallopeptidase [Candidatus Neomarinimicrobiota bacterium]MBT4684674.1 M48 family metallopeptidase [Candidatus Neomarinimicrobiota bacterium]MBT5069523.1 M48 family metallopeptidase [Candidatus Neomarinimicrobiota bacterium]MBT6936353.1 M48 family metallopeptidase [Candidatus Neomarinimicrobiota bacterium]
MEQTFYIIIMSALIGEYLLSTTSSILNMRNISPNIPDEFKDVYDEEKYKKSQDYLKINTRFGLGTGAFGLILIMGVIHTGFFGYVDEWVQLQTGNFILQGLLFFLLLFIAKDIISLPFTIYSTFVIEERFGFNRTTVKIFVTDLFKGYALTLVLGSIILSPILYFFETYQTNGWWIAWSIMTVFMIAIQPLFVHIISPMFNTFTPLEDGPLRNAIDAFSEKVQFPIARIDVMDGSKRSSHSNAYFTGFGKSKRVALYDTLMDDHSENEIVSIVAHEVGHYKKKHIIKGTILGILETGLMLFIFNLIKGDQALYSVFGVENISIYAGLLFFGMLYAPVSLVLSIFTTALSRKNEFEADAFAKENTQNPEALIAMLKGLAARNLSHLTPHPLTVFLSYSHPPVSQRIEAIK